MKKVLSFCLHMELGVGRLIVTFSVKDDINGTHGREIFRSVSLAKGAFMDQE